MSTLYERYRPQALTEVVGQSKAVATCQRLIERESIAGHAIWISGESGTGKTTLALILAKSVADPFCVTEVDAGSVTVGFLRGFEDVTRHYPLMGNGYALIINEAHGLGVASMRHLLVMLEHLSPSATVIFTTTNAGQAELFGDHSDAGPLLSRCVCIKLTNQGLANVFAARALEIAQAEGLDGRELPDYVKLVKACKNNMRSVLTEIENRALQNERSRP